MGDQACTTSGVMLDVVDARRMAGGGVVDDAEEMEPVVVVVLALVVAAAAAANEADGSEAPGMELDSTGQLTVGADLATGDSDRSSS